MKIPVLIIDDHQLFSDGLSLILKESNQFDVVGQVFDSRQAIYQCLSIRPSLVLIDFNMPEINGLTIVNELKAQSFSGKIVVISMYAGNKEIEMFKDSGVDGYLPKTTPASKLIDALCGVMSGDQVFESLVTKKELTVKDSFTMKNRLTKREADILRAIKKGMTTEDVANYLNLSYYTVETHRKNINQKLNIRSKVEFYDFLSKFDVGAD
ncbi:response regulator transcription factor [Arsenicibacter rosenii]|uniref:DNA-binding response regulator n=1 Tax=Arsenicibacter rosenii TaxID=1750698 RepID=A0A1S2V9Y0_9BACT|nr:response regulator transcription factor [Arsenicibacter rosenii]OIN55531.1 hypothetical protein BLX24_29690 [Arsenicibacter rosenii]